MKQYKVEKAETKTEGTVWVIRLKKGFCLAGKSRAEMERKCNILNNN